MRVILFNVWRVCESGGIGDIRVNFLQLLFICFCRRNILENPSISISLDILLIVLVCLYALVFSFVYVSKFIYFMFQHIGLLTYISRYIQ